ncbi:dihydrofolate reductase [Aeromicrobium sp.]|nr:dihydrofolate reductase [Candidatus Saccharibacteria bacterium]
MIRQIVALDRNRGIAKDGVQPWKLSIDEQYFTDQTKLYDAVVLMGRRTYETIGRPLSGRQNFVLSRDKSFEAAGATVVHDIDVFLATHPSVWIIGGRELYDQTLGRADELYITEIYQDYDCDVQYPNYKDSFELVQSSDCIREQGVDYYFKIYKPSSI